MSSKEGIMGSHAKKTRAVAPKCAQHDDERVCCGTTLTADAVVPRSASATDQKTFAPGSCMIEVGQPTHAIADWLNPNGIVNDSVHHQHIPVEWAINTYNSGLAASFTSAGKTDSGGSFVTEARFDPAQTIVATWKANRVVVERIDTEFIVAGYDTSTSAPRTDPHQVNSSMPIPDHNNAENPQFVSE
jgi:hypothetical protein